MVPALESDPRLLCSTNFMKNNLIKPYTQRLVTDLCRGSRNTQHNHLIDTQNTAFICIANTNVCLVLGSGRNRQCYSNSLALWPLRTRVVKLIYPNPNLKTVYNILKMSYCRASHFYRCRTQQYIYWSKSRTARVGTYLNLSEDHS